MENNNKESVSVLRNMIDIYKENQVRKKNYSNIDPDDRLTIIGFSIFFSNLVVFISLLFIEYVISYTKINFAVHVFLILYIFTYLLLFFITVTDKTVDIKTKLIKDTILNFPKTLGWKLNKKNKELKIKEKVANVLKNLSSCSFELNNFFKLKRKEILLEILINEMRLPNNIDSDISVELEDVLYDFEKSKLFPDISSFRKMAQVNRNKKEYEEELKFFEKS